MKVINRHDGRSGTLFGLVTGLILGVLLAVLVIPERQETREIATGTGTQPTAGAAAPSSGAGGEAVGGGGQRGASSAGGPAAPAGSISGGSGEPVAPGGPPPTTPTGSAQSAATPTGPVRGVADNKMRIGIAVPDLRAIAALGPGYDQGDLQGHAAALLESLKREKVIPVHGRDVEFAYRSYNILDANAQRAACVGLVQDEKVFAVVAIHDFAVGSECVAREFQTLLITTDAPTNDGSDAAYRRAPLMFTLQMSLSRLVRNWPHWANERGLLRGKRIGLYYGSDQASRRLVEQELMGELAKLGQKPVAQITTDQPATGGPQDTVAVQRFRTAGVDLAMLLVSSIAATNFMQQADAQGYRPLYIDNDLAFATTDTAAGTKPVSQYGGTFAMTGMRFGEWKSGRGIPAPATTCQRRAAIGGRRVDPNERDAEWIAMNQLCDEVDVLLRALQTAGRGVSTSSVLAALESSIKDVQMGIHANVTFAPGKHHGVDQQRTIQFNGSCRCWKVVTDFGPLFRP